MEIVNTQQLLKKLINLDKLGLEVSTKRGILSLTKAVYHRKGLIYLFAMEEKFTFSKENAVDLILFQNEYENWFWKIEQTIS